MSRGYEEACRIDVRSFNSSDIDQAIVLMRELAEFEGYLQDFAVTGRDLKERGLGANPDFGMLVAVAEEQIVGIAVFYVQPWTYDLRPTLVLKELYVTPSYRSSGVGRRLFEGVVAVGRGMGAPRLTWLVLPHNERAKKFYSSVGGSPEDQWHTWKMAIPDLPAQPNVVGGGS